jgi:Uri superfamily endonuclease
MYVDDPQSLPAAGGAYALLIHTHRAVTMTLAGRKPAELPEARYLYAGSANGPGGIRARVGRHLKGAKTIRWHVDRLTNAFGVAAVIALPGGRECALLEEIRNWDGVAVAAPGFGSSDCRACPAHLVMLPEALEVTDRLDRIIAASGASSAVVWHRPPVLCILPTPGKQPR